jgi:hypothetical protein
MDPYLEARWPDVHSKLIAFLSEALQETLPPALRARSEERVLVEEEEEGGAEPKFTGVYASDIAVVDLGPNYERRGKYASQHGAIVAEPIRIKHYEAPETERVIHIIDRTNGNKIITAIEILSPWNKASGRLNKDYRKKLRDYDDAGVNVVEIDLLRNPGRGNMRITEGDLPLERRTPYLICIGDAQKPGGWDVYPVSIRAPLPTIPIPLRPQDKPARLDLQPLIQRVYKAGGHDDIDYTKPLDPALSPEDTQWVDQLLRGAGKRAATS